MKGLPGDHGRAGGTGFTGLFTKVATCISISP